MPSARRYAEPFDAVVDGPKAAELWESDRSRAIALLIGPGFCPGHDRQAYCSGCPEPGFSLAGHTTSARTGASGPILECDLSAAFGAACG